MTYSGLLACLWILIGSIIALMPRKIHWRGAYFLMATLIPISVYLFYENGWVWGCLFLLGVASMLRWPLRFLARWIGRKLGVEVKL